MSRNKYVKYCDEHRINDGLLKNWLARELYPMAYDEIDTVIQKLQNKIASAIQLQTDLENNELNANKGEQQEGEENE